MVKIIDRTKGAAKCKNTWLQRRPVSKLSLTLLVSCLLATPAFAQDKTDDLIQRGNDRLQGNQQAQKRVDALHEDTQNIIEEYQTLLKVVEGLKVYNAILQAQLDDQDKEINDLNDSISNAAVIERQILPLLTRMLDGLENYIEIDVPFLHDERIERVNNLRRLIMESSLSNAEKTRRVFEAYQIENDFGNTIETYKGKLNIGSHTYDVDFLRVGRISFLYRAVGAEQYGYWSREQQAWLPIEKSVYKRNIDKGIKMARQEMAPELLTIPISPAKEI